MGTDTAAGPADAHRWADTIDHSEIRRLLDAYADAVSRRSWDEVQTLFLPDARLRLDLRQHVRTLVGPAEIVGVIGPAVERFEYFQFVILGVTVHLRAGGDPLRATARTYMSELRQDGSAHAWSQIFGVYHDHLACDPSGVWRFADRSYHSMARREAGAASATVFEFPHHLALGALASIDEQNAAT